MGLHQITFRQAREAVTPVRVRSVSLYCLVPGSSVGNNRYAHWSRKVQLFALLGRNQSTCIYMKIDKEICTRTDVRDICKVG